MMIHKVIVCAAAAFAFTQSVLADEIAYIVDGASGEYCGQGYRISVSVSKPKSGATVQLGESETGPWHAADSGWGYTNACSARPMYFKVTATGYSDVTGSADVEITPKELTEDYVWLMLPAEDYVYDGTAKEPETECSDGSPSIITKGDYEVTYENNVDAGMATATFTGKGNYTGVVTEDFEILKADNGWVTEPSVADWTYGQAASEPVYEAKVDNDKVAVTWSTGTKPTMPGDYQATFTVPESDNYNELERTVDFKVNPATISYIVDGASGEYCGQGYRISVSVSKPKSGATVQLGESETGPWHAADSGWGYTNACSARPMYFKVTATGYSDVTGSADVEITPKELTEDYVWLMLPAEDYVYDGTAKEPETECSDGSPSIITKGDYEVTYENNVDAGMATATFTGKGNYTGVVTEDFEILKADNSWVTEPSVADWTYGQQASEPVYEAKVDNDKVAVTWSTGTKPTMPGDYQATFTVPESDNYNELERTVDFKVNPATISYIVDGASGEYCGQGYRISVSVSKPKSGATVQLGESETGPWHAADSGWGYTNACSARPMYFKVTATGYSDVTGSADVEITPKELTEDYVWLMLPAEDYVYDGTAKEPDVAFSDGDPSIMNEDDFEVEFVNNVDAGTATAIFTGKNNYAGIVYEDFTIEKAKPWEGDEPGGGVIPPGGISKFDVTVEYDGNEHTIDTNAIESVKRDGLTLTFSYALEKDGDYQPDAFAFTDVVVTSYWYKICFNNDNYEDYRHEARLVIAARDIDKVTVAPIPDVEYAGVPVTPIPVVTDGVPSIITADDYDVSYLNNDGPGTASVILTGKNNYIDTKTVNFTIKEAPTPPPGPTPGPVAPSYAELTGKIAWKLNLGSGCYTAQLVLSCESGVANGISSLRFLFADRKRGEKIVAALWDSNADDYRSTTTWNGATYRQVELDGSRIVKTDVPVVYGVEDISEKMGTINAEECAIELYVRSLAIPDSCVGYVVWTSGGEEHSIAVSASDGSDDDAVAFPDPSEADVNVFVSRSLEDKAAAASILNVWKGNLSVVAAAYDEFETMVGWNVFNVKVANKGVVTVTARLVNGKSISVKTQMLAGENWCRIPVVFSIRDIALDFTLWLPRKGGDILVQGLNDAVASRVGNIQDGAAFMVSELDVAEIMDDSRYVLLEEFLPIGTVINVKGNKWKLPSAGTVRIKKGAIDTSRAKENPTGLKLSYNVSAGSFTGSFKVYRTDGVKMNTVSATIRGVVVDGIGYGTAKVGKFGTVPVMIK